MSRRIQSKIQVVSKLVFVLLCFSAGLHWYAEPKSEQFPEFDEIVDAVFQEPKQYPASEKPFEFDYRGATYVVEPRFEYSISGVVVTHNDIMEFTDIYHDEDSVDIKDLCVVWGDNADADILNELQFWSEPWTCYYQAPTREANDAFNGDQLSNSHLLSDDGAVRELINSARVGDQIYMRGMLVDYYPLAQPEMRRETSVVRTDTGNGACEVVFVEDFKILQAANSDWREISGVTKIAAIVLGAVLVFFFFASAYAPYLRF